MSNNLDEQILKFKKQVRIDRHNLSEDIARNPSYLFSAGLKKSLAEKMRDKTKLNVKIVRARIKEHLTKKKVDGKKLTIPQMESAVDRHEEVIKAEQEHIDANYNYNVWYASYEAVKEKGQQLTNLAYNYRKELGANVHVKETSREERVRDKINKNRNDSSVKKKKKG